MIKVAFAGTFAARLVEPVRTRLSLPCELIVGDEASIVSRLSDIDVLVSVGIHGANGGACVPASPCAGARCGCQPCSTSGAPAGDPSGERLRS